MVQSFAFDAVSRLATLTSDLASTGYDQIATFSYNPASQIDTVSKSNDAYAWGGHYNIDRVSAGNGLNQLTASIPGSGQVSVPTLTYDARGNLATSESDSFSYTSDNKLASTGSGVYLANDMAGRLIQVYANGGANVTPMDYLGNTLITEMNGSNQLVRRYVHGPGSDAPIVWYEGSGTSDKRYLTADERGSIVAVTDSSGNAIAINSYDEYGKPGSGNSGRFGYTGQTWLPDLGQWYYKARIYNPALGRFMQTDPIGYGDGMNWYDYVGGDPVNATDPSGECTGSRIPGSCKDGKGIAGHLSPSAKLGYGGAGGYSDCVNCGSSGKSGPDGIVVTAPKYVWRAGSGNGWGNGWNRLREFEIGEWSGPVEMNPSSQFRDTGGRSTPPPGRGNPTCIGARRICVANTVDRGEDRIETIRRINQCIRAQNMCQSMLDRNSYGFVFYPDGTIVLIYKWWASVFVKGPGN